jgi:N-acetylglucosamine-6-phosphate deacetylase
MGKITLRGRVVLKDDILADGAVVVEGEKISGIYSAEKAIRNGEGAVFDYGENYIAPGLIDLHLHGAHGKDVMDADAESLEAIAGHQARCGVTGFVPTTLSAPLPSIVAAANAVKEARGLPLPSEIVGIHLEGPFLSLKKKGAQNPEHICEMSGATIEPLLKAAGALKVIMTVAPESGRNLEFIPELRKGGVIISIGHSQASYELAVQSFERGVSHATHLFNAMSGFEPREPGVIGAVLDSEAVTAEVIADGVHVHPASLRIALRQKGPDKTCLVTDSVNATGLGDGDFRVGGLEVAVRSSQARLKDSGALAGSVLTLNAAVRNIINWTGVTVSQAIGMASLNPARLLGLEDKLGSVQAGKYANLAVFDEDFHVVDTVCRGRSVLTRKF